MLHSIRMLHSTLTSDSLSSFCTGPQWCISEWWISSRSPSISANKFLFQFLHKQHDDSIKLSRQTCVRSVDVEACDMILVEVLFEVFVKLLQPLIAKKNLEDDNPKNKLPTYSDSANILNIFFFFFNITTTGFEFDWCWNELNTSSLKGALKCAASSIFFKTCQLSAASTRQTIWTPKSTTRISTSAC